MTFVRGRNDTYATDWASGAALYILSHDREGLVKFRLSWNDKNYVFMANYYAGHNAESAKPSCVELYVSSIEDMAWHGNFSLQPDIEKIRVLFESGVAALYGSGSADVFVYYPDRPKP